MADATILAKVKLSLRIITDEFDTELSDLIDAAVADLGIAGVPQADLTEPIIIQAVTTYCKLNFGEPDEYDRLKKSYDEQKAQLGMSSTYNTVPAPQPEE
jgi:hypothetical protein